MAWTGAVLFFFTFITWAYLMYMRSALLLSKAPRGASVRVWGTSYVREDTALFINYVICKNNELQATSRVLTYFNKHF
jgi:hypothetical protein